VRAPERDVPSDYLRAIDEVVSHLDATRRARAVPAADGARRVVALLERCDRELGALALGSGAPETDRIAAQLATLESTGHEDAETRELAALLRAQLAIVQRMRVRCEMLSARRSRLLLLLHGLWTRVSAVGALAPEAAGAELARLDAVREEIEAELGLLDAAAARPVAMPRG
jgi:hypothetical protein